MSNYPSITLYPATTLYPYEPGYPGFAMYPATGVYPYGAYYPAATMHPSVDLYPAVIRCLVWYDDFNGEADTAPNPAKWAYETGGFGWAGGAELQAYTDSVTNAALDGDGHLVITARQESEGGADYTSARLITEGLLDFNHGYVEARIKLPTPSPGIFPAFWTLGHDRSTHNWPVCGEIDIIEAFGAETEVHFNSHQPTDDVPPVNWNTVPNAFLAAHAGATWADDWHIYAMEWTPDWIAWFVDGRQVRTGFRATMTARQRWTLDAQPQHLVLNIAVGGAIGDNDPDETSIWPNAMLVDYVRVYANEYSTFENGGS